MSQSVGYNCSLILSHSRLQILLWNMNVPAHLYLKGTRNENLKNNKQFAVPDHPLQPKIKFTSRILPYRFLKIYISEVGLQTFWVSFYSSWYKGGISKERSFSYSSPNHIYLLNRMKGSQLKTIREASILFDRFYIILPQLLFLLFHITLSNIQFCFLMDFGFIFLHDI